MFNQHGLIQEAKSELIGVIFSSSADADKAQAYYLLGNIAFDEDKISVALDSWRDLVEKYPNSTQAEIVKDRINELAEIVGDSAEESIENAIALSYLRHGDFWSGGKGNKFTIDVSFIEEGEAAIKWYDKIILEFPKSTASLIAYESKIRTLLFQGWEKVEMYNNRNMSFMSQSSFEGFMSEIIKTFTSFKEEHPTASALQALRYQIAQSYWRNEDWAKTREWLNLIINESGEGDSFYKDLAERRIDRVEY